MRIAFAVLPEFGETPVSELSTFRLRTWHQELAARPASLRPNKDGQRRSRAPEGADGSRKRQNTANRYLTTLKALLNFSVSDGKVPLAAAAAWKAVKPFRGADKPRVRHFESGEIGRLLNGCDPDFRRLVSGALLTGARYGELISARVSD
jgi:integrase